MNENIFHYISFPENYAILNQCITDLSTTELYKQKKLIPIYHGLFIITENNKIRIHPKFGTESEFSQLYLFFPVFSVSFKIKDYSENILLGNYNDNIHSIFLIGDKLEINHWLENNNHNHKKPIYLLYKDLPTNQELEKLIPLYNKSNYKPIFPFYLLDNPNSVKKQLHIMQLTEPVKIKIGFYPKEICQSFIDPRKYHLLFTLLSSLPFSLVLLNGQETLRNFPSLLISNSSKEDINYIPNIDFLQWLCKTRGILQHYRNMIKKYRCPTLYLRKNIIWLEYQSLNNENRFKIGFNFEKLFIRVSQPRIYQMKTIWYNKYGAHIDQSGIKKHLAPFGIALLDNFDKK